MSGTAPILLLSMPQMTDPNFAKSVVLLCEYTDKGAFGLVVNRQMSEPAWTLVKTDPPIEVNRDLRLWVGGPVETQRTWVLLFRNADRIHDCGCLPGWLSTTARREALAVLRSQQRAVPTEDVAEQVSPTDDDVAEDLMRTELSRALHRAVDTLPVTQRRLVRAMLREEQSYDTLSRELDIPRGSLGPLRGRAVRALRAQLEPSLR